MTQTAHSSDWQTRLDGELSQKMISRINILMASSSKLSLSAIARAVGLSPTFVSGLVRGRKAIRSRHMPRFNAAIEQLERQAGINTISTINSSGAQPGTTGQAQDRLVELMAEVAATLPAADRLELLRRIAGMR